MKNKVIKLEYIDFTDDKVLIEIPRNYLIFNNLTLNFDKEVLMYPENVRIINDSDVSIYYNFFQNDSEYEDFLRNPLNLYDHIEIKTLKREFISTLTNNKYIHIKVDSIFTNYITVELFDYETR
jgi:hypothetical protein